MESFNGRVRDELLNVEEFGSLTEAAVVTEAWRIEYNTYRPQAPSAGSPLPNTPNSGLTNTNQLSHDSWTNFRGPLTPGDELAGGACAPACSITAAVDADVNVTPIITANPICPRVVVMALVSSRMDDGQPDGMVWSRRGWGRRRR